MNVGSGFSKYGAFVVKLQDKLVLKMSPREVEALVCKIIPLHEIEQKVIHLRFCQALSHKQISKCTGLSERSVRRVLENVVAKIQEPRKRVEEIL